MQTLLIVTRGIDMPPPVDEAVGYAAAYGGRPMCPRRRASLALALVFGAGLVVRWRRGAIAVIDAPGRAPAGLAVAVIGPCLADAAPNLAALLLATHPRRWPYDWDRRTSNLAIPD